MLGGKSDPSETGGDQRGWFREFLADIFKDYGCGDWVEFVLYAAIAVGLVVTGIVWLIGRF